MTAPTTLQTLAQWGPDAQGSTRAVGLMRIGLGCIALVRFGQDVAPWAVNGPIGLLLGALFFLFAAGTVIGIRARLSTGGLGLTIFTFYGLGVMQLGSSVWAHHHVYILAMGCLLLSFTDCGKSFSWDRWRMLAKGAPGHDDREHGTLWGQRLIALQLSALYFWTAVDKTDWAFVSGQRLEQTFVWVYSGRSLAVLLDWPVFFAAASVIVLLVEYWLAVAILFSRWRAAAICVGLTMHAGFYLLLPVNTYSVTIMVLYLALLKPDAVHRFIDQMTRSQEHAT
jgi:hypothetical protein